MRGILFSTILLLAACSTEQKPTDSNLFKGVSQNDQRLEQTSPNYQVSFPLDHGEHPSFGIEWWYITANLTDDKGNDYGLQWTLFRTANPDVKSTPWSNNQSFMGHSSLHGPKQSWFEQKFARGGVGNAAITLSPFTAFIDDWAFAASGNELTPATLNFSIHSNITAELSLQANKPLVLHGKNGYSQKFYEQENEPAPASFYYSQPHIQIKGQLNIDDDTINVSGNAWFDHEWTSQVLPSDTSGWDWFALHLNDGSKLMLARVRHLVQQDHWIGTFINSNGQSHSLTPNDINAQAAQYQTVEGRDLPLAWHIDVRKFGIELKTQPMKVDQWVPGLVAYYEGAIEFHGSHSGKGFMELTGY
jgi:predicted secreted hydrolase